jgi:hypothetical protein
MPAEFTGEQKLRIVLESIIRGVPKEEQCQKYGISPEQFQSWHDHLIKHGGKIYESKSTSQSRAPKVRKVKYVPWYVKLFLFLSLFSNLAAAIVWGVWYLSSDANLPIAGVIADLSIDESEVERNTSSFVQENALGTNSELDELIAQVDGFDKGESGVDESSLRQDALLLKGAEADLDSLLVAPVKLPSPPSSIALEQRVEFLDQSYEGKHVVYVMDVGSYQLKGPNAVPRLEEMKLAVLESLTKLSSNSYFNLVLCWNLRDAHALGKTILRANDENKRYATEWLTSLGTTPALLKEGRNQFYPKELLYAQVLPGVIGPWYGLATAASYDPDIVFFLAGNMPDFSPDEVSRNDYNGLGLTHSADGLESPQAAGVSEQFTSLIRKTAAYWLLALQSERNLPEDQQELEDVAMRRLSLDNMEPELISRKFSIPWTKAFDNFLAGLELGIAKIPQVHVFQTLPEHIKWPTDLQKTMAEFCESTKGSFNHFGQ